MGVAIDLCDGLVTPGMWGPPSRTIMRALNTIDFRGKKVLDIGCWDGLWSFEAEKRGATTVVATDLAPSRDAPATLAPKPTGPECTIRLGKIST